MVNITINGSVYQVEEGLTILEAAQKLGIKIPTLCYHKELSTYGACRVCLVEILKSGNDRPGLRTACQYKVKDGLVISTDNDRVKRTRKIILELLLARCPDSVRIKQLAAEYGVTRSRIRWKSKDNCILCGLCVRVCSEISQRGAINFAYRGKRRTVQPAFDKVSDVCIGCGACAYICPTQTIKIEEAD